MGYEIDEKQTNFSKDFNSEEWLKENDLPSLSMELCSDLDIQEIKFENDGNPYSYSSNPIPRLIFRVTAYPKNKDKMTKPFLAIAYFNLNNVKRIAEKYSKDTKTWIGKKAKLKVGKNRFEGVIYEPV